MSTNGGTPSSSTLNTTTLQGRLVSATEEEASYGQDPLLHGGSKENERCGSVVWPPGDDQRCSRPRRCVGGHCVRRHQPQYVCESKPGTTGAGKYHCSWL